MRVTSLFVVALACFAASAAASVSVDHDASADFAKYKTYSWMPGTPAPNPLNETRIHEAIDAELAAKGLTKVESGGDLVVVTHASAQVEQRVDVDQYGYGGPTWGRYRSATTSVNVYTVKVGHLLVDMLDGQSRKAVWRGEASDLVSDKSEKNAAKIAKIVPKLFKKFPPPR
jgi:hypothetical protein